MLFAQVKYNNIILFYFILFYCSNYCVAEPLQKLSKKMDREYANYFHFCTHDNE